MNLAVVVLLMVYISLWAFKTLDDIGVDVDVELDDNDKDNVL